MNFTCTPKNTPTPVTMVAVSSNQCGISQGQAPSLSRGNYPYTGYGEGPGHPGKHPPGFGYRRTGLPCRNVGSSNRQHQEPLGRGQFPTTLTSLASYSPCCSLCRCISFCAVPVRRNMRKLLSPGISRKGVCLSGAIRAPHSVGGGRISCALSGRCCVSYPTTLCENALV